MVENFVRVTKWIGPNEKITSGKWGVVTGQTWCHNEAKDMEERTNNRCQVHVNKDGKIAIHRDI